MMILNYPSFSQKICEDLLYSCSTNAFHAHKKMNNALFQAEIISLSNICSTLLMQYHVTPQSIISLMETAMQEVQNNNLQEIDCQIKHLFNLRRQAPADTSYGEQEIIKLTTQITYLEELKKTPIKECIQGIIYETFNQVIKFKGIEMPEDFNLNQYKFKPDLSHDIT